MLTKICTLEDKLTLDVCDANREIASTIIGSIATTISNIKIKNNMAILNEGLYDRVYVIHNPIIIDMIIDGFTEKYSIYLNIEFIN